MGSETRGGRLASWACKADEECWLWLREEGGGRLVVGVERWGSDRRVWLEEGAGWRKVRAGEHGGHCLELFARQR